MEYLQDEATRNASIISVNLLVIKSNPMFRREKIIKTGASTINRLGEEYEKIGSNAFSNERLVNTAPGLVSYSDNPVEEITVPYGWGTERLAFDIVVSSRDQHSVYKTVVKGYTDKCDVTFNNTLNPDTMFYVDSVINTTSHIDPMTGALGAEHISSAYTVMTDPMSGHESLVLDMSQMTPKVSIRPEEVIMGMATQVQNSHGVDSIVLNTITSSATEAKNKDLNPLNNVAEILESSAKEQANVDFYSNDYNAILNTLAYTTEYRVDDQPFFKRMAQETLMSRVGQFSFHELNNAFGDLNDRTTLVRTDTGAGFVMDGDSAGANSVFASMANMFLDASLSYLKRYSIVNISFTITNRTLDGSTEILLLSAPGSDIYSLNLMQMANKAMDEIKLFAFPMITQNKYDVSITAHITKTDALIQIEFQGRPMETFSFPLLAYSLSTPVIGTQVESNAIVQTLTGLNDLIIQKGDINENNRIIH